MTGQVRQAPGLCCLQSGDREDTMLCDASLQAPHTNVRFEVGSNDVLSSSENDRSRYQGTFKALESRNGLFKHERQVNATSLASRPRSNSDERFLAPSSPGKALNFTCVTSSCPVCSCWGGRVRLSMESHDTERHCWPGRLWQGPSATCSRVSLSI